MRSATLALDDYRRLVALDEPFEVQTSEERDPAALLRRVLSFLEREHGDCRASRRGTDTDARLRVRSLLTARPPGPMPRDVQDALDTLLRVEQASRPSIAADALPRFVFPGLDGAKLALWQGDITTLAVDAIVNAANAQLLGCFTPFHACIDNAIHAVAGPRLRDDCYRIMQAQGFAEPTGCAKVTRGYHLPSRFVLHTVGPIVNGALTREHETDLARSYRACLDVAAETGQIQSLAFCAISTGVFGFAPEPAARIALGATRDWLVENPGAVDLVVFNVFSARDHATYAQAIEELSR